MMTLEEAENEIYGIYRWFAQHAPGVVVQTEGRLSQLWSVVNFHIDENGEPR